MSASKYLKSSSREYAIYVCRNRAIPAVQDGLKHGQRIALFLLARRAEKIKTVALGGDMARERLYVHGDVSANNAIGLLAAPYKNNVPLIEGLGQFGSRTQPVEGIGAPRYTEVRRSKAAEAFLYNDLDIAPMMENYDGSNFEPVHFLPLIPTVLLNGVSGIAVGWSTEILSRSLKGLVQASLDALDGAKALRGLEPAFARYDVSVKPLGTNQWEFEGKVEIVDTSTVRITELPPGMAVEAFRKRLIAMEDAEQIASFADRSAESIDISVRFKRGSLKNWTPAAAIETFKLRERVTERIVVIDWCGSRIATYQDPAALVRDFVSWRLGWYTKRYEKLEYDARVERDYWRVIKALFDAKFPTKLGKFANRAEVEQEIDRVSARTKYVLHEGQMDRACSLPTYRWTKDFETEVIARIASLEADVDRYVAMLSDPEKIKAVYRSELEALKKLK